MRNPLTNPGYGEQIGPYRRKIQSWAEILQQFRESFLQDFLGFRPVQPLIPDAG